MQLQIADCLLRIEGGNEILDYLPHLLPFALPEAADSSCLCKIHLGCTLSPCSGTPDMVAMPDGRQIRYGSPGNPANLLWSFQAANMPTY